MRRLFAIVTFAGNLVSTPVAAVTIDFDALADGVVVTNQFPEATFSSNEGFENRTTAQNLGSSLPNFICTARVRGALNCAQETIVVFMSPVNDLSFVMVGDGAAGTNSSVDIDHAGSTTTTGIAVADGIGETPHLVDLSSFRSVTRIRIHSITDPAGLGWDDFTFTPMPVSVGSRSWGAIKDQYR